MGLAMAIATFAMPCPTVESAEEMPCPIVWKTLPKNLDFSNKFVNNARDGVLNLEGGALNITKLLSNPFVIGAGVLGLVIVSKI